MNKIILPIAVVLLISAGAAYVLTRDGKEGEPVSTTGTPTPATQNSALYASVAPDYTDEAAVKEHAVQGFSILYFTSPSCASCVTAEAEMMADPAMIPAGVKVFRVPFDTSAGYAAKYEVSAPDTWVQVNAEGAKIASWQGGGMNSILTNMSAAY